jgi:hypothetical protein
MKNIRKNNICIFIFVLVVSLFLQSFIFTTNVKAITNLYLSDEVGGGIAVSTREEVENLKNQWSTRILSDNYAEERGVFELPESNPYHMDFVESGVSVEISLRDMEDQDGNPKEDDDYLGLLGTSVRLNSGSTMQDSSPLPISHTQEDYYWNESSGRTSSRNAVLFTFSEPVGAFGAWFGDLETRTDGEGVPAVVKVLDENLNLLAKTNVEPTITDQSQCGSPVNDSFEGCGNETTRWISFVEPQGTAKYMLVVVGDDDSSAGASDYFGYTEHISFTGLTLGYSQQDDSGNGDDNQNGEDQNGNNSQEKSLEENQVELNGVLIRTGGVGLG